MAYGIEMHGCRYLRNYAEAEAYYNNTAPVRNAADDRRPLQNNRNQGKTKYMTKEGRSYALWLYETACVVFHPDGRVELDFTYQSNSTNTFINHYLPTGVYADSKRGVISVINVAGDLQTALDEDGCTKAATDWKVFNIEDHHTFATFDNNMNLVGLTGVGRFYKKVLDKKRAAKVRRKAQPFIKYATTMAALCDNDNVDIFTSLTKPFAVSALVDNMKAGADDDVDLWADVVYSYKDHRRRWERTAGGVQHSITEVVIDLDNLKQDLYQEMYERESGIYLTKYQPLGEAGTTSHGSRQL